MALSYDLISQFAKLATNDTKTDSESTVYGTVKEDATGNKYVLLDQSDQIVTLEDQPSISFTAANVEVGDRVSVLIKNHTATITGNVSSPAARNGDVQAIGDRVDEIREFDIVITKQVQANEGYIKELQTDKANVGDLAAATARIADLEVGKASIKELNAAQAEITDLKTTKLDADVVVADEVIVENLKSSNIDVLSLIADKAVLLRLISESADISSLEAKNAYIKFANVDFANISEAAFEKLFSQSGIIESMTFDNGTVTGRLVGVTIRGDLIEANTLVADKLVIQGEDGLYYKLNFESGNFADAEEVPTDGLHGSVIVAKSITAEKVAVSDLVAFGATIGGFTITDDSLYSGVKESVDNSTRGTYIDSEGQFVVGDAFNYIKFYKLTDASGQPILDDSGEPVYKLEISADSILFGDGVKSSAEDIKALTEHVKIGTVIDNETGDEKPCVELAEGDTDFKQVITNTKTMFMDGKNVGTTIDTDGVQTDNLTVDKELRHNNNNQTGSFVWAFRSNGNYGLSWKGV